VADLVEWQQRSHAFVGLAGYQSTLMNLTDSGTPDRISGETVTANYFPLLGVQPALGRTILPEDDRPGAPAVVLISDEFWRGRLGADTGILGRSITLDAHPYQVIGVLPRGFEPPRPLGLAGAWALTRSVRKPVIRRPAPRLDHLRRRCCATLRGIDRRRAGSSPPRRQSRPNRSSEIRLTCRAG